jgi:hypothetical protein
MGSSRGLEMDAIDLNDPTAAALVCAEALDRAGLAYAFYGGLVLAAYGEPRETRDVDVAVIDLSVAAARAALAALGVDSAPTFEGITFGGLVLGRVTLLGGEGHLGLNVLDLVRPRSARFARAVVDRAVTATMRGRTVRLVTAEDYVTMKALATRDRDLDDAASVLRRSGALLDVEAIDREVASLAAEIPDWDLRRAWATIRDRSRA